MKTRNSILLNNVLQFSETQDKPATAYVHLRTVYEIIGRNYSCLQLQNNLQFRHGSRGGEMGEFSPPSRFSEPPSSSFFFFFLSLKYLNQALVLLHCYKNSPPISKSWIRACSFALLAVFILSHA